ncbi:MAG: InlB B-repeat-containing protein [Paludibacteraceae bacterium]|nr:InlB B-repeat-containing protein [Paludibacteraceae bacterium]
MSSSTPANAATDVAVSGNITLTFSENVTINDASKFTLSGGAGTLNTASATASGTVVTIPYSGLANNTTYTLATAAEAVKDGSNNKNAALSNISFTTVAAAAPCPSSGTIFSMTMLSKVTGSDKSLTASESVDLGGGSYATVSDGTATFSNTGTAKGKITKDSPNKLRWDGNAAYLKLDFDCELQTGDSIIISGVSGCELSFTKTTTYAAADSTSVIDGKHCFIVPAGYNGVSTIYGWRSRSTSLYITGLKVTRPAACTAPNHVDISGNYHFYPGETLELTATAYSTEGTSNPIAAGDITGYQWQKYIGSDWENIVGETSATYTKANATTSDVGQYRCIVSTGATCSTTSDQFDVKCLQLYVYYNDKKTDKGNMAFTKVDDTHATASFYLELGSYDFYFKITDGCNDWWGNTGKMNSGNHDNWSLGVNSPCGLTTTKAATYVFNLTHNSGLTTGGFYMSVVYPAGDQGGTYDLYFANDERQWTADKIYYRIGKADHNQNVLMTKVDGTANLYHASVAAYNSFLAWHVSENCGWSGSNSIYKTKNLGDYTINRATFFEGAPVPSGGITVIPGSDSSYGSTGGSGGSTDNANDNCSFYSFTTVPGMWTHTATISDMTNGSVRLNWTDISDAAQTATSTTSGLAHTCNLQITGVPDTGYDVATLTVNGSNFTSGDTHVLSADATIAATFALHNYNVTYSAPSNGNYTIKVADGSATSATKTATMGQTITLAASPNTGYSFTSWTVTKEGGGTETVTNNQFTMPADNVTITATFTAIPVASITVSPSSKTLVIGDTQQLTATVLPATALDKTYTWLTGDESIATVTAGGLVTAVAAGSTTITATANDGSGVTGTCAITVNKKTPTKQTLTLSPTSVCAGGTATITMPAEVGVTYQLYHDNSTPIDGTQKTASTTTVTWEVGLHGNNQYKAKAIETAEWEGKDMNNTVTLSQKTATSISSQPSDVLDATVGVPTSLSVTAAGENLSYQWKQCATVDGEYANVASGGTSATYNVTPAAAGTIYYKVVVTGDCGTVTSDAARIVAAAAGTTYYLVTSTAQLNTTDTYIIANSTGTAIMSTTTADTNKNPDDITSGFSVDGSTLTVTSASPNLFKLTSGTYGWLFRGGNGSGNYISSDGTPDADLWYNTSSTPTKNTGEWNVSLAGGIATMKLGKAESTTYHIYYDATNTKFIQSTTTSNIKIYTSNSTPVYTVTYDLNGGEGTLPTNRPEKSGTVITLASSAGLTKDGFTFDGWLCNVNSTKYNAGASYTMTAANTTFTAQWEAVSGHTVTYNYNGATGGAGTPSATGASVTLPTPTKTDCSFQGWYTSGGTKAGDGGATYNPAADITLYALWREDCAGSGTKTLVDINFKDASWSGKTFSQANDNNEDLINGVYFWSKSSDKHFSLASNTSNGLTFPNNNMSSGNTYFCIPITGINSSDKQITVTLKHGYGSNKASYKYVYVDGRTTFVDGNTNGSGGEAVSDAANADTQMSFTKGSLSNTSGHLIIGRNSSSYTQIYGVTVTTPNNATCYYVTYNGNGATGGFMTDETAHGSGDNVAILANTYTRTGYTFTGWKTAPSSGTSYEPEGTITGISSNITLYAQWSAGTLYSVTYNGNGATSGSVPVDASSPYASGSNVTVLGNTGSLALANYTFDGWATVNDGTGTSYTAGGTVSSIAADVELFAKWKQTVTLNTGSQGSEEEKTPYIYINGAALNGFSAHSAAGYTLNGYYSAASGGTKVLEANGSFADTDVANYVTDGKWSRTDATTLYAQWRAAAGSTCYEWDATETKPQTGTNVNFGGLYLTAPNKTKVSFYSGQAADSCYDISAKAKTLYGNLNGLEISSVKFAVSSNSSDYRTIFIAFCSSTTFSTSNIIEVGGYQGTVYTVNKNDAAKSEFTVSAPAGTKSFAIGRNMDGITYSESFTAGQNRYLYYLQVCSAGGGTHTISYNAGGGTGTMTSDADIADDGTKTLKTNTFTAPTNYSFAGWVADGAVTIGGDVKTAGTLIADGATITNITMDIALTAKWTQSITLNANTSNHGTGDNTSATVMYNATALSSISHTSAESGYKLTGYFTADTDGTKVLNSDGTFAGDDIAGWISDGKWTCTAGTRVLYAQYESSGSLIWNLGVNTAAASLTTSSKTSAFTEIAVSNMTNAAVTGLTYTGHAKSNLTGKISTPASEDAGKYVSVTFQVADGYKFTPNSVKVKVQPISAAQYVKLELTDNAATPNSISYTTASKQSKGSTSTVEMTNGSGTYFTGTVTLKIFCYGTEYATDGYRLGTPISIDGEVEELCATMPSFTKMNYTTTTFTPNEDATGSPISIEGGENINTYRWKYNTTNDRTSGTNCGTNSPSLVPLTDVASGTTRYYWCEMTNTECGITIKSPAVAITVAAAKSDATVTWTNPASTPNYGGGGYTIKATVNETGWNGNAADLTLTAPAGIRIYNIESGETASKKWVQASFDVTTAFDRTDYPSNIPFTVSADATSDYNAISNDHNISYSACTGGGGDATEYLMPVNADSVNSTVKGWRFAGTGKMWFGHGSSTPSTGSNIKSLSNTMAGGAINKYYNSGGSYFSFYTETAITGVRLYVYTSNSNVKVSNVYIANSQFATGTPSSGAVTYEVVYNDDNEGLDKGDNVYSAWAEITFDSEVAAGKYGLIKLDNNVKIAGIGLLSGSSSGADLTTTLAFATPGPINDKTQSSVNFTNAASVTAYSETLGQITYSSSNTSCATVNPTTGEVTITASGADNLSTTITATLSASGCYKSATATYTINIPGVSCTVNHGTLSSDVTSKCETEDATLTLTDFESGASVQWYNGETPINNSSTYAITTEGTTSTMVTKEAGTYSVMVTNATCSDRSNSITISNISATASVTKIVDEWYVKNGRLTPDIELWSLSEGATLKSVAWSPDNETGLSCVARGGVIYLEGKSPSSNDSGNDIEYTLTATITDECNADHEETTKTIKITHQKNTDKHVLAFVVNGTAKGGFTAGITAAQTTSVGLYNAIAAQFDVLATNIYATDDEKKLKEYYSQFDILCITDYPNTQTKGANSKSYVDAIGSLIDIRPILTMEAFVSKLANWKAKGISGNPKSPTTRQYTMDLQCKDHEIFAGTKLTKVGEGDEAMYRVSMVDNTKEDYATLDATYGGGAHAEKDGYNYGGKPALQGFTFTQEMIDNDLLPIGLIDDGASNPLQVGIERQHNMEARLMVLGINSYAMERLTDDGERVVINALNYLMKKNQEDIADCSTAFVGGAEGDTKNWDNKDNWTGNTVPLPSQKVRILADCEVNSRVYAQSVLIVTGGKYNHGSDNAAGKLTIKENGALIVGGKIQAATAPAYNRTRATTPDRLLIETSSTNQAALIFDNEEGETQATVNYHSKGYNDGDYYQFQYFAIPMDYVAINPVFADEANGVQIYTYAWDEPSNDWERRGYYSGFSAFEGLAITTTSVREMDYALTGNLASTAEREITLTHGGGGDNMIGNSWMAPINIASLVDAFAEDENVEKTVYIYCAGNDTVSGGDGVDINETEEEIAGQWLSIPMGLTTFPDWGGLKVIPAMQAYLIKATGETTLTLNYDEMVRSTAETALNEKLRAPKRRTVHNEDKTLTRLRVADSRTHTDLYFVEGNVFSDAFDNGWEATYMPNEGASPQFYAMGVKGKMAVLATDDFEGTVVGFEPGKETAYTISFSGAGNGYYLNDVKTQASTLIIDGEVYSFEYEAGDDANRFYISRTPLGAPAITTGINNPDAAAPKVLKVIYNDKLYIIRGGKVYSADGQVVK